MSIDPNIDEDGYEINGRQSNRVMEELEALLDRVEANGVSIPMVLQRTGYRLATICAARMVGNAARELHENKSCGSVGEAIQLLSQRADEEDALCHGLADSFSASWSIFLAACKEKVGNQVEGAISK